MTTKQDAIKLALEWINSARCNPFCGDPSYRKCTCGRVKAIAALSAISEAAQPVHKTCREVPKGNGYCINCANGDYEKCLYCPPKSQPVQDGDALRQKFEDWAEDNFVIPTDYTIELDRRENSYKNVTINAAWEGYQQALSQSAQPSDKQAPTRVWGYVWKDKRHEDMFYMPSYTPEQALKNGELFALVDPKDLPEHYTQWHELEDPTQHKHPPSQAVAPAQAMPDVTDKMVTAYLSANEKYWFDQDALPSNPTKWRNGTPREATMASLKAALQAAPQPKQEQSGTDTQARDHDGYAYRYPDGVRFTNGEDVNGSPPLEAIPYWLGSYEKTQKQ